MGEARWAGYIKDYEGGTLMECVIHKKIEYLVRENTHLAGATHQKPGTEASKPARPAPGLSTLPPSLAPSHRDAARLATPVR